MTYQEILDAVNSGKKVLWNKKWGWVFKGNDGSLLVNCNCQNCFSILNKNGKMNRKESEFSLDGQITVGEVQQIVNNTKILIDASSDGRKKMFLRGDGEIEVEVNGEYYAKDKHHSIVEKYNKA